MFSTIDRAARRWVSWPLVLIGIGLSYLSAGCIRVAAWLANIDLEAE